MCVCVCVCVCARACLTFTLNFTDHGCKSVNSRKPMVLI